MSKVIQFPHDEDRNQQNFNRAFAAFAAEEYDEAIAQYEAFLQNAVTSKSQKQMTAILQLGQAYLAKAQNITASELATDFFAELLADEAGRGLLLQIGMAVPDFSLISAAVTGNGTQPFAPNLQVRAAEFETAYTDEHASAIAADTRKYAHLGAYNFGKQELMVNEMLRKLPRVVVIEVTKRLLIDPDVYSIMRVHLANWLQQEQVDAELAILVNHKQYLFNPSKTADVYAEPTINAILTAYAVNLDTNPDKLAEMYIQLSSLYPVANQLIFDAAEFAHELSSQNKTGRYAELIGWLHAEMTNIGSFVNN